MRYIYASGQCINEDYSSGRVFYGMQGTAPFPVRLACEVFERCRDMLVKKGIAGSYTIYDPFCGGGFLLAALGFIHGDHLKRLIASDIDKRMVSLAGCNLGLLSIEGINKRIRQIEQFINAYKKESHRNALESALRLYNLLEARSKNIEVDCFCANATKLEGHMYKLSGVDLVITDLPYGKITAWTGINEEYNHVSKFLESLHNVIPSHAVAAIVSDKKQKVKHDLYRKIDSFNAGKRRVTILEMKI